MVRLLVVLFTCLISAQLYAAISSQVDRTIVEQGQTFVLMLELTQNDSKQVDLAPLEKDFEVVERSHQSSTRMINGHIESNTSLAITLAPKRAGKLEVPSLMLNGEKSEAHFIEVTPVKQLSAVDGGVELLSTLSDKSPILQQPIIYQMNLVLGQPIYNPSFQEPKIKLGKALIQTLGEQRQYRQTLNGREVLVVEQSWLITPQQSGILEIEGAKLSAEVRDRNTSSNSFRSMNGSRALRRIFLTADNYKVDVDPIPASFSGAHWLAASELTLSDELSNHDWKVGEPVTRTIKLHVKGVGQSQLSDITLPDVSGMKQYPAKPVYEQEQKDNQISVDMTQEVTIIPNQQGALILPEVRLAWWNTKTNQEEVATLPTLTINVAPSDMTSASSEKKPEVGITLPPSSEGSSLDELNDLSSQVVGLGSGDTSTVSTSLPSIPWRWVLLIMLGSGFFASIVTIFCYKYFQNRAQVVSGITRNDKKIRTLRQHKDALNRACKNNNPLLARDALVNWGRAVYPDCTHLNSLQNKLPQEINDLITELNACCYDKAQSHWDGKKLVDAINAYKVSSSSDEMVNLKPLIPH